jgi:hypothetical protein
LATARALRYRGRPEYVVADGGRAVPVAPGEQHRRGAGPAQLADGVRTDSRDALAGFAQPGQHVAAQALGAEQQIRPSACFGEFAEQRHRVGVFGAHLGAPGELVNDGKPGIVLLV